MAELNPALLGLHRSTVGYPGLGEKLLRIYGSAESVYSDFDVRLSPIPPAVARGICAGVQTKELEQDLAWAGSVDQSILTRNSVDYPRALLEIPDPPLLLFTLGNTEVLAEEQIAIVGSRRATATGMTLAGSFASELSASGLTITSGMALGIDAAAHRGALTVGGKTIAVQGVGAGNVYPRRHQKLAADIACSGCVVTEYPTGFNARAHHFPQRNRIVTGLCRGVLVVEAAAASGSLISARIAMEQGREVFAVPGPPLAKQSEGCHQLIRQGAKLAANLADVLEEFADFRVSRHRRVTSFNESEQAVLDALANGPQHADRLFEQTSISIDELMTVLIHLEIQGEVVSSAEGYRLSRIL